MSYFTKSIKLSRLSTAASIKCFQSNIIFELINNQIHNRMKVWIEFDSQFSSKIIVLY